MKSQRIMKLYLSYFGVGYSKYAPGTMGSIATIPLMYYLSLLKLDLYIYISILVFLFIISCVFAQIIQKKENLHDPQWIVMDEVIGMLVTWLLYYPTFNVQIAMGVLIVFRFFDIIKIWPASYFDTKVTHGYGTILDDVLSAFYAIFVLFIIQKFITLY